MCPCVLRWRSKSGLVYWIYRSDGRRNVPVPGPTTLLTIGPDLPMVRDKTMTPGLPAESCMARTGARWLARPHTLHPLAVGHQRSPEADHVKSVVNPMPDRLRAGFAIPTEPGCCARWPWRFLAVAHAAS